MASLPRAHSLLLGAQNAPVSPPPRYNNSRAMASLIRVHTSCYREAAYSYSHWHAGAWSASRLGPVCGMS